MSMCGFSPEVFEDSLIQGEKLAIWQEISEVERLSKEGVMIGMFKNFIRVFISLFRKDSIVTTVEDVTSLLQQFQYLAAQRRHLDPDDPEDVERWLRQELKV